MQNAIYPLHQLESYDYFLPKERIAQNPVSPRDASKLLLLLRENHALEDRIFRELPVLLRPGDLVVLNNTRVFRARLQSDKGEVLLVKALDQNCWDSLVFPGRQFKPGASLEFHPELHAKVLSLSRIGRILQFEGDLASFIENFGKVPLPPYIDREATPADYKKYQAVYAKKIGSVAAPTAGLHFTRRTLNELAKRGIGIERITLHVGPGTFRPVKNGDITKHQIDPEYYICKKSTWERIRKARRIIAVGTTTARALETMAATGEIEGYTDLFIYPGYSFQIVEGLLTNFHLPKSSLLMLVSAFGGYEFVRNAYRHAMDLNYRFYSYGDAMLIL